MKLDEGELEWMNRKGTGWPLKRLAMPQKQRCTYYIYICRSMLVYVLRPSQGGVGENA